MQQVFVVFISASGVSTKKLLTEVLAIHPNNISVVTAISP